MPITHVGSVSGNVTSSPWTITLNLPAGTKKNDLVVTHVFTHRNHPNGGGSRFQELTDYKPVGVRNSFYSVYQYKFMGQSPDTSVTLNTLSVASGAIARVFRGVDLKNPIDCFYLRNEWQDVLDSNGDGGALDPTNTFGAEFFTVYSPGVCIINGAHFGDGFLEEFGTITPPSGWTGQVTVDCDDATRDNNEVVSSCYKIFDSTSAITEQTFGTWNASGATVAADPVNGFDLNDNGGSADTIVRNDGGSWISDGFAAGREVAVANATNASNNGNYVISSLTASTLTIPTGSLAGTTVADLASSFASPVNAGGTDEPFLDLNQGISLRPADAHTKVIYYENGTTSFTLPDDFDPDTSMWFLVGGAASGADAGSTGGGGGGGPASLTLGGYTLFSAGDTVYCQVGAGGTADSTAGTDTWVSNVVSTAPTAVGEGALAVGGGAPSGTTGGTGGFASNNIPATANLGDDTHWTLGYSDNGGNGGDSNSSDEGGGGGAMAGFFGATPVNTDAGGNNGGNANLDNYGGGGGAGSGSSGLAANNTSGQEVGGADGYNAVAPDFVRDRAASGTAGRDGWFGGGGGGGGRGASGGNSNAFATWTATDGMTLGLSGGGGGGGAENTSNVAGLKGGDGFGSTTTWTLGLEAYIADIPIGGAGGGGGEGSGGGSVDGLHGDGADGIIIIAYQSLDGLAIWDDNEATVSWTGGTVQAATGIPPGLLRRAPRPISRSF